MAARAVRRIAAAAVSLAALGMAAGPVRAQPRPPSARQAAVGPTHAGAASSFTTPPELPADYSAVGGTVKGRVGDTVVLQLGVRNLGPEYARMPGYFAVAQPPGTTITSIPWVGDDDDSRYMCRPPQGKEDPLFVCDLARWGTPVPRGPAVTVGFHIRIDRRIKGAAGYVTTFGPNDPVLGNNRAAIAVDASPAPFPWRHWALGAGLLALAAWGWRSVRRRRSQGF